MLIIRNKQSVKSATEGSSVTELKLLPGAFLFDGNPLFKVAVQQMICGQIRAPE